MLIRTLKIGQVLCWLSMVNDALITQINDNQVLAMLRQKKLDKKYY